MMERFSNDPQIRCRCGELMRRNESCMQWECARSRCDEIVTDELVAAKRLGTFAHVSKVDTYHAPPPLPGYRWVREGSWGYYERTGFFDEKTVYAKLIQDTAKYYGRK